MGLGVWTTVEGVVYPSSGRYGGGFQWMVDDEDRTATNKSKLRLRPYIIKYKSVSDSNNDTRNPDWQKSYFKVDGNQKDIYTAFNFQDAKQLNTIYPVSSDFPFKTNAENKYVEYEIPHNDNGTATVSVVGLIKGEASSNHFQKVTTNAAITLPPINRVATVSAQDTPIGGTLRIFVNKANPESKYGIRINLFEDDVNWNLLRIYDNIAFSGQGDVLEWNIPAEVYSLIPTRPDLICEVFCETYTQSDQYVGYSNVNVRLYVDEVPEFNVTATTDSTDGTLLINGISTVTINVTDLKATTGASAGFTFNISDGERSRSTNPAYFEKAKKDTYFVTVTDGRGISATKQISITNVSPYVPPSIGSVDIQRDIEKGTAEVSLRGRWTSGVIDGEQNKNEFVKIHIDIYEQDPEDPESQPTLVTYEIYSESSDGLATVEEFSDKVFIEKLKLDKAYTLFIYALDIYYNIDSPIFPIDFPAVPFKVIIRRAVPVFQWKEGTLRINGNLEVTGTYPGGSGGGGDIDLSGYVTDEELNALIGDIGELLDSI